MVLIAPTVTANDVYEFRDQLEMASKFARRIHIDLMDGIFAPTKSPDIDKLWLPEGVPCDIHVMYQHPMHQLDRLIKLKPNLVIFHAEAILDFTEASQKLSAHGIKCGVALLPASKPNDHKKQISMCDHCLIFAGHLGYHGGVADLTQIHKADELRSINKRLELGWDGGVNLENATEIARAGFNVLNVGGAIQKSADPRMAYKELERIVKL